MRHRSALAAFLAITVAAGATQRAGGRHVGLPASAQISVGRRRMQDTGTDAAMCRRYRVTVHDLRHYFATYRLVTEQEKHYLYQVAPCTVEGTILLGGRTFVWTANPGGFLSTTFPDGVLKTLGATDPAYLDTAP